MHTNYIMVKISEMYMYVYTFIKLWVYKACMYTHVRGPAGSQPSSSNCHGDEGVSAMHRSFCVDVCVAAFTNSNLVVESNVSKRVCILYVIYTQGFLWLLREKHRRKQVYPGGWASHHQLKIPHAYAISKHAGRVYTIPAANENSHTRLHSCSCHSLLSIEAWLEPVRA